MTNEISSKNNARWGNGRDKNLAIARMLGAPRQPSATPLSQRRPLSPPFAVAASPTDQELSAGSMSRGVEPVWTERSR
jgi:hypothetical protein